MKTQVAVYDLDGEARGIDKLEGYPRLLVLFRRAKRPVALVPLEIPSGAHEVTEAVLKRAAQPDLGAAVGDAPSAFPDNLPPISVVVCTRDRAEKLARCLDALGRLDYPDHEVLIVDNAPSDDATARLASETAAWRYVREDRPGLDWARNRGWREARHSIVAYVDDDVVVDPHWLRGVAAGFTGDPGDPVDRVGAVTGLVVPLELETRAQHLFERYGGGMNKGLEQRRLHRSRMSARELIETQWVGVGANMAYRRELLERLGGFDTALDVGTPSRGVGDLDMFHRVLLAGELLVYEPAATCRHEHRPEMAQLRRQLYDNGCSFGVYLLWRLRDGGLGRGRVAFHAVWRWGRWLVGRTVLGLLGRHRLPLRLLLAELWGALHAPWAYRQTRVNDRRVRERFGVSP